MKVQKKSLKVLHSFYFILGLLCSFSGNLKAQETAIDTNSTSPTTVSDNLQLNLQPLKLSLKSSKTSTQELLELLNQQDMSLENLENQWHLLEQQLVILGNNNNELSLQLSNSLKLTNDLQQQLTAAQNDLQSTIEYNKNISDKLAQSNQKYRSATAAGLVFGTMLGIGCTILVVGAVQDNKPLLYSGLGIGSVSGLSWGIGKIIGIW